MSRSRKSLNENEKICRQLREAKKSITVQLGHLKNPIGTTGQVPDNDALIEDLEGKLREIDGLLGQFKM